MSRAIIILADGFEEIEAVTCIDLLRRAEIETVILGLDAIDVRGSRGIWIKADMAFDGFNEPFDAIILPGGMPGADNLASSEKLLAAIRKAYELGRICAAICAAPLVFAKAGILNGKKATCYPGCESRVTGASIVNDEVVTDGNIITSRAVGTAIPFALEIIKTLAGKTTAEKIKAGILY